MPLPSYMSGSQNNPAGNDFDLESLFEPDTRTRRGRSGLVGLALTIALSAIAGLGYWWYTQAPKSIDPILSAAPSLQEKAFCLDASGSVDQDGHLSRVGADALVSQVNALNGWKDTVPTFEPSHAAAPIHLQVRLVRADSYSTKNSGSYSDQFTIPAVSGLRTKKPLATDPSAPEWDEAFGVVGSEQQAAKGAQKSASASIAAILKGRSDGSDITGCVAASLDAAPRDSSTHVLVVSDLQDNSLTTTNGDRRTFGGDYASARLTIVQACPSGVQSTCDSTAKHFLGRMAELGIAKERVAIVRPEQVERTIGSWLAEP